MLGMEPPEPIRAVLASKNTGRRGKQNSNDFLLEHGANPTVSHTENKHQLSNALICDMDFPRLIGVKEAAYLTGLSRSTIFKKMRVGYPGYDEDWPMPVKRNGSNAISFDLREIRRWIEIQISRRARK